MTTEYSPPLAINFIWHPSDSNVVTPILDIIRMSFARDKNRPFSRGLNVPLFFFSSQNSGEPPSNYPKQLAKSNIVFAFTSVNTVGKKKWRSYIEGLPQSSSIHIVPIAVDSDGYGHVGSLTGLNCIRTNDWPVDNSDLHAMVALAHEIYRFGCNSLPLEDKGKKSSITIFLALETSNASLINFWHLLYY